MPDEPKPKYRNLQLDFMRGIAILLVIGHHWVMPWQKTHYLKPLAKVWFVLGWSGVDLFFVLSGFLIGGLLMKEIKTHGSLDVKRFLIRRGFKIWPLYFLYVIAFTFYLAHHLHSWKEALIKTWPNYLQVQNYFGTPMLVTWSLAVEEHFYIVLPFVLLGLLALTRKRGGLGNSPAIPITAIALIIACTAMRFLNIHVPVRARVQEWPTHLRIDGLFLGVLIAYVYHFKNDLFQKIGKQKALLIVGGLALVAPMAIIGETSPFTWTIGYTMLYFGYAMLLIAAYTTSATEGFGHKFFANPVSRAVSYLGFSSYPIYLFHSNIGQVPASFIYHHHIFGKHGDLPWIVVMVVYIGTSWAIGAGLAKLVEIPTLALRDRMFPSKADGLKVTDVDVESDPAVRQVKAPEAVATIF